MLLSATVTGHKSKVLMFSDISRAYIHARTTSDIRRSCVRRTRPSQKTSNRWEMLTESMYGTGAAGHDWQSEVARRMTNVEFNQGKASPRVFWHRQRDIKALVQGDDFVPSGEESGT